ncbi:MAG: glycosyltransferase [Acidobacteriales bacterium]|nr:glycosyltransferase [Terriglobales bacterium]
MGLPSVRHSGFALGEVVKVLLVHNEYRQPGGEEVVVEQERRLLEAAGHVVVPFRRSNWDVEDVSGFEQLVLAKKIVWSSDARRDIAKVLDDEKPDVVHVHNTFMAISPSIYSACQKAGVPVIQTLHNYRLFCPAAFFFRDGKVCEECVEHSLLRGFVTAVTGARSQLLRDWPPCSSSTASRAHGPGISTPTWR